jgi:hypothetical protein
VVTIATDANSDGYLNATEVGTSTTAAVKVSVPSGAVAGDTITLTSNGSTQTHTLSATDLANGYWSTNVALPASGSTLTETATVSDPVGNVSAPSAAAVATVSTVAPTAPAVAAVTTTSTDPSLSGTFDPTDGLSVTVDGQTYTLGTSAALTAQGNNWTLNLAEAAQTLLPGVTYTVSATATDAAGNEARASAPAQILVPPPRPQTDSAPAPVTPPPDASLPDVVVPLVESAAASDMSVGDTHAAPIETPAENPDQGLYYGYTATDDGGFRVPVMPDLESNLVVFDSVPDQQFDTGDWLRFKIAGDTFVHTQANATVHLFAELQGGGPLPGWLHFNASAGEFSGQVPAGARGEISVHLVARDNEGHEAATNFRIKLGGVTAIAKPVAQGRPTLSQKLAGASRESSVRAIHTKVAVLEHA